MDNELFNELLTSIQEAGKIMRGEMKPVRVYEFEEPDVKEPRMDTDRHGSQSVFIRVCLRGSSARFVPYKSNQQIALVFLLRCTSRKG